MNKPTLKLHDLLEMQGWVCNMCGKSECEIKPYYIKGVAVKWHVDHILSVKNGGKHTSNNIQALCWECNIKKGAR